ncbi:MAG: AAA family ATPase [Pseudonocardiaceae bacterium]
MTVTHKKIRRATDSDRPPRLMIYARHKKGKSKLCSTANLLGKGLFLDPEHGTDWMTKLDPDVWDIEKWEDLDEAYRFLKGSNHDYDWVYVDGLTRINTMSIRYVLRQSMEKDLKARPRLVIKKTYYQSGEQMKSLIHNFHSLDMGVIFTAQERVITVDDDDESDDESDVEVIPQKVADLPAGVRSAVNSLADVIGRLYITVNDEGDTERRLWVAPDIRFDTGYRSSFVLPEYLSNPTIPKLIRAVEEGKVSR